MPTPHDRWTAILRDFDSSGLTATRFCARRRLARSTFHRWRKRLGHRTSPAFIEALPPTSKSDAASTLTVELRCGLHVSVSDGFDDLTLARVIRLLERIDRLDLLPGAAS
jgi:hypothetical protein